MYTTIGLLNINVKNSAPPSKFVTGNTRVHSGKAHEHCLVPDQLAKRQLIAGVLQVISAGLLIAEDLS